MSTATQKLERIIKEMDRVAIMIDGHAMQGATRTLGMRIDWKKFQEVFMDLARVKHIGYYLAVVEDIEDTAVDPQRAKPWWRGVIDWMAYNNYRVTLRRGREFRYKNGTGSGLKTNIDLILATDAMGLADNLDHVILFSGNVDYVPLIEALQAKNVCVTIISNSYNKLKELNKIAAVDEEEDHFPFIASKLLIRSANNFIDLHDLQSAIGQEEK